MRTLRIPGDYWTSIHRPIVAFDRVLGDGISSIGSDHEQGGRLIAQMLIRNGAKHVVMIGGPRDQFFDLAARGEVEEGPFDLGKTTFPTVRYYLTLEQELTSAGVKYEYVEAGEVMDFAGYHRAVSNALDKVTTDASMPWSVPILVHRSACAKRWAVEFPFLTSCRSLPTMVRI